MELEKKSKANSIEQLKNQIIRLEQEAIEKE